MRCVALLRGINVGRAKRIAMADLRKQLASLGYENVRTVLNSGNAIFDVDGESTARTAVRIAEMLPKKLGVAAHVIVLTAVEVIDVLEANPLKEVATDPARLLVAFVQDRSVLVPLRPLMKRDWTPEAFAVGKHAAYLWCANGVLASALLPEVDAKLGDVRTTRNCSTVDKIVAAASAKP